MDHPISIVEKVLNRTHRPVTRHWLQQAKKRARQWPATNGKGRLGDRYSPEAICQVALFFDLGKAGFHHKEGEILSFNEQTRNMFRDAITYWDRKAAYDRGELKNFLLVDTVDQMNAVFMRGRNWELDFEYVRDRKRYHELEPKIRRARLAVISNLILIALEVSVALETML